MPSGTEFQVNTYTDDYQLGPSVTGLADGGFVVTWQSYNQDVLGWGVYGQRYATREAVGLGIQCKQYKALITKRVLS